jgi:hypothetical protein
LCWVRIFATTRAVRSVVPPGPEGAMISMDFSGFHWASASPPAPVMTAHAENMVMYRISDMKFSLPDVLKM